VVGGEYGTVLCERGIVRMSYVGSPLIFQFDKVETSRGCPYPGSVTNVGPFVFYLAGDGFYLFDGNSSKAIGSEKVDRTFFDEFDRDKAHRLSAAVDPANKLVVWGYPVKSGSGTPTKFLVYNYQLGRWSSIDQTHDLVATFFSPSYTLEGLDNVNASLDALTPSLDDVVWIGGEYLFGGGRSSKIQIFNGANLTATIETGEFEFTPGRASLLTQVQPYLDRQAAATAPTVTAQVASRVRPFDTQTYGPAVAVNSDNFIPLRSSGRFHQVKFSATDFGTFQGYDAVVQQRGLR